jgi:hypothetical protein
MRRCVETWALAAALAVAGATGCSRAVRPPLPTVSARGIVDVMSDEVPLWVRNNTQAGVKVFVLDDGEWRDLGFVAAGSTESFDVVDLTPAGAPLRLLAIPSNGQGSARAGPLTVLLGQAVTFTIEPELTRSFAVVR